MATKTIFLKGKLKWAHTSKPDKYDRLSVCLYPDAASLEIIRALKEPPAILNTLKMDDDGTYIKLGVPPNQMINGKVVVNRIEVLKPDGSPLTESLIGNGSDGTIKCEVYTYRKGEGRAIRPKAIRVDNLIPYTVQGSFTDEQKAQVSGVMEQPVPVWG